VLKCVAANCSFVDLCSDGFSGADKVFLIEFSMPDDGSKGFEANMPAIVSIP